MLEQLLRHFRSYGMKDLEFIIVNSKLPHSQEKLHELQRRVSFDVYQETDEEEVWSVMEGGKDDMFVYDRCGKLTYFVPFPLSILNETPLVSNAILATYFRSPCGTNCDSNSTLEFDTVKTNLDDDTNVTEEYFNTTTTESLYENGTKENETFNDLLTIANSEKQADDVNSSDSYNITDYERSNNSINIGDYDYPLHNETSLIDDSSNNSIVHVQSAGYFSNLYRIFKNTFYGKDSESNELHNVTNTSNNENQILITETHNYPENNSLDEHIGNAHQHHVHDNKQHFNDNDQHDLDHRLAKDNDLLFQVQNQHAHANDQHASEHNQQVKDQKQPAQDRNQRVQNQNQRIHRNRQKVHDSTQHSNIMSDRCLEADYAVCKSWSKKRLLHAQKCCSSEPQAHFEEFDRKLCENFGKKRCKKIQSILKCCIKTLYTEETTTEVPVETSSVRNVISDVVCCKNVVEGKECRVSETGICREDEFVSDDSNDRKCTIAL